MKETYLISACLFGELCRYDGEIARNDKLVDALIAAGCKLIPVCPEVLGGLKTPRPAAQIKEGNGHDVLLGEAVILDAAGANITDKFVAGAKKVLQIAQDNGIRYAILNERSPSCGVKHIYNGQRIVSGMGVTTALLLENGIKVESDEEFMLDNLR